MVFSTYCMNNSPQTDQNTHTPVTLTISTGCIQGEIKSLLLGGSKGQPKRGPLFQDLTLWVVKRGMCRHFTCWGNRHAISLYYARLHVTLRGHCFKNKSELFLFHWVIRQCFRGIRSCLIFELLNKCWKNYGILSYSYLIYQNRCYLNSDCDKTGHIFAIRFWAVLSHPNKDVIFKMS